MEKTRLNLKKNLDLNVIKKNLFRSMTSDGVTKLIEILKKLTCFDENSEVYTWDLEQHQLKITKMKDIQVDDKILTIDINEESRCQYKLEPVLLVTRYTKPLLLTWFLTITIRDDDNNLHKLTLHRKHYVQIKRDGRHQQVVAENVILSDKMYICPTDFMNTNNNIDKMNLNSFKMAFIESVKICPLEEMGNPINIWTSSRNLVVNGIWSTSRFCVDGGDLGHSLVRLASKIHPQGAQFLYNVTRKFGFIDE